ncbi:hypothetical protein RZA67_03370 [Stenotrophomonas sp. C3(2023)]|uniref:hypothetical protein n=1 Tax=Stenotrophomonas sp. C3(2023) TaxID=3080277 RepID=UPI00293C83BF|nr:hypothetical protein [Stenotrophomonas sp. C3(2023)]MDV3467772.1 hypothetical protein [Stenotrophomonas sp. C3(2023)]
MVENILGEEAARTLRVPRGQRGEVTLQLLMGEASVRGLTRTGGLLATGLDAVMTARAASALMEQGNMAAAQSEVDHAVARNIGGWLGGASTAAVLGSSSGFVPAALIVGDAVVMSKAFDKGVDLKENRAVFDQTDRAGVHWRFDGRNWQRQAKLQEGQGRAVEQEVAASYAKSLELGAMANAKAAEFALGKAPLPQNPFNLPAQPGDRVGLDNQNWHRNPVTRTWERQVKTGMHGANDRGLYASQLADAEQTRRLNQQALARIEENIANGREAVAQAFLEYHAVQRGHDYGLHVPAAVDNARARHNRVQGHDGQTYQRSETGQWLGKDGVATGNLALELELTHKMRQPSLQRAQATLATISSRPAPTAEQMEHNELVHRYRIVGIDINAQAHNLEAVKLATQRTRDAEGLSGPTMQRLKPNEQGRYGYDSQIIHYQLGRDGVAHQVAVTTPEAVRQARAELSQQSMLYVPTLTTVTAISDQQRGTASAQERATLERMPEECQQKQHDQQVPRELDGPEAYQARYLAWQSDTADQQGLRPRQDTEVQDVSTSAVAYVPWRGTPQTPSAERFPADSELVLKHRDAVITNLQIDFARGVAENDARTGSAEVRPATVHEAANVEPCGEQLVADTLHSLRRLQREIELADQQDLCFHQSWKERSGDRAPETMVHLGSHDEDVARIDPVSTHVQSHVLLPATTAHAVVAPSQVRPGEVLPEDPVPADVWAPRKRSSTTGDPHVDEVLYALDSRNEWAIEQALTRVANSPATHALLQRGNDFLELQARQEALEQAVLCQTLAMEAPPQTQSSRGPVMVMTLPGFVPGPQGAGGGNGEGGAGEGGDGG